MPIDREASGLIEWIVLAASVEFRLFGPVRMCVAGADVALGPAKQLCFMASLLLEPGTVVPTGVLVDRVWGPDMPRDASGALATYASRLRSLISRACAGHEESVVIHHLAGGYRLDCDPDAIDLHHARRLVRLGRRADGDEQALGYLSDALSREEGLPLGGLTGAWATHVRDQLVRERLDILIERLDIELRLGRYTEIVPELLDLAAEHPLAEHVVSALMRALCAAGRPAEALDRYAQLRGRLAEELGCEPAPQLQDLFRGILRQAPELFAVTAVDPTPALVPISTLPRDTRHFVGRREELDAIRRSIGAAEDSAEDSADGSADGPAPPVIAIDGMPGVGKTALAIHAARSLAPDYPDGQLFLNVRVRAGERPADPATLLDLLLRTLGVAADLVPKEIQEREILWRSITARRRLLLVLDDVTDVGQVRALLPGDGRCAVLLTSRRRLVELDAALALSLGGLSDGDAADLFHRVSDRQSTPDDDLTRLIVLCGHLPLAIRIAAARLRHRPSWTVAHLVQRLTDHTARLTELASGEQSVSAAFHVAYGQLDEAHQRMFRLLGVHPAASVDRYAATALAGPDAGGVREIDAILQGLVDEHLIDEPAPGAYLLHDLIRLYAGELAAAPEFADDRARAELSLVDYYLAVVHSATARINPQPDDGPTPPTVAADRAPSLETPDEALAWLEDNHVGLRAVVSLAGERGWNRSCWQLAASLRQFYNLRGHLDDWLATHSTAYAAALQAGDGEGQANMQGGIVGVYWRMADYDAALRSVEHALDLRAHVDNPVWLARTYNNHGMMLHFLSRYPEALDSYERARALFEQLGDTLGEAGVLNNASISWQHLGNLDAAADALRRGLKLVAGHANVHFAGMLTGNLGSTLRKAGHVDEAVRHLEHAVELRRQSGAIPASATALNDLATAYRATGRLAEALDRHREAIATLREVADRSSECVALNDFGFTLCAAGEITEALEVFQAALTLASDAQQPYERARALIGVSRVLERRDAHAALEARAQAMETFSALGVPFDEELNQA